ncbi:hypothetical protein [Opitutus terrae]|uniref:Uncharacterized protein n=1 Tax=Opitutus terrae (strain DSM 11246 / JCM 15787 / PB90-1) TaxID=452637 RepID=B1ZX03_OPITP|nr:hypothetical protein [Opitutus terrae]ACB75114.1 hypothetical protein Oter_1831 [Opitutus terrae PB90-1]
MSAHLQPIPPPVRLCRTTAAAAVLLIGTLLQGCTTVDRARFGDVRIITGQMSPLALRWEIAKASAQGWEVVSVLGDDKSRIVVLRQR